MARARGFAPWLLGYWAVQALVVCAGTLLWFATTPDNGWWYSNPLRADLLEVAFDPGFLLFVGIVTGVITLAQGLFLVPVRRPGLVGPRGRSLRLSLVSAGLAIGALVFGTAFALVGVVDRQLEGVSAFFDRAPVPEWVVLAVIGLVCWTVPTVLLIAYVRRGRRETVLSRIASRVLIGTAAEVCLLIPLDAMVRRKTDCYCAEGTFIGLTLAGWVGVFAAGPAVFLPLLAKRRKRWYGGHCAACGYDMSGSLDADRCPECGVGWRASGEGTEIA